jgi:hypothetical protein
VPILLIIIIKCPGHSPTAAKIPESSSMEELHELQRIPESSSMEELHELQRPTHYWLKLLPVFAFYEF